MIDDFNDNRALSEEVFNKFCNEYLAPFIELVKKHNKELEFCFRGNDSPPSVCIYYNNHVVFKVYTNGQTEISFHHARYSKCWKNYYDKLIQAGFEGKIKNKRLNEHRKYTEVIREIEVRNLKSKENISFTFGELDNLYTNILLPMFQEYFKAAGCERVPDYFKYYKKEDKEISGFKVDRVPSKLEKIRQHELFTKMTFLNNDYFFYDMEFAQKHKSRKEREADKENNQPDMLAIKFDNNQKPEKIVLVEVKCNKNSLSNKAGIKKHFESMKSYVECINNNSLIAKSRENRKIEACQIMNHYAKLGLRGLTSANKFDVNDFTSIKEFQILLIFTDDAIHEWKGKYYKTINTYKLKAQIDSLISNYNLTFDAEFWTYN